MTAFFNIFKRKPLGQPSGDFNKPTVAPAPTWPMPSLRRRAGLLAVGLLGLGLIPASNAQTRPPTVLVVGDSLSAEYGLKRGSGWVALLEQRLAQDKRPVTLVNASISGETTSGGRSRLAALIKQHQPSVVVVELGANDALRGLPLDMTEANLRAMVQAAQQAGAKVLLLGMQMPPNYGAKYGANFAGLYAKVAKERKAALVPFFLKGVADVPDAAQLFQSDRIHPNEKAHPVILDNVWPELRKLLT